MSNNTLEDIILSPSSHKADDFEGFDNIVFYINDSFQADKCNAAEIMKTQIYAPGKDPEYDDIEFDDNTPYVSIIMDDDIWTAVNDYKENGRINGALEFTPLSGRFYFKAKIEYYNSLMYFYGFDSEECGENCGLCMVYPVEYSGTENEKKLMQVLDEAAESYTEEE